jgi:hypothetical protein
MARTHEVDKGTKRRFGISEGLRAALPLLLALIVGCAGVGAGPDDDDDDDDPSTPAEPKTVVYAAGSYSEGGYDLPCYWRDGTRVALPFDAEDGAGRVAAIALDGGTVYTAGSTGYHDYYSCYWAGTERTDLEGGGARGIDAENGSVYAAVNGDWSDEDIIAFGGAYYAGAAFNRLPGIASGDPDRPEHDTGVNDIAVAGGTVYTAGRAAYSIDDSYACYWTGADTRTNLDASAEAMAICVSGGTVYTAGRYYGGGNSVPCIWIGAARTDLPIDAGYAGYAEDITVDDGTVYAAGYCEDESYNSKACYWIGGTRYDLPGEGTNSSQAYGICVFEDSIYVSGCYNDGSKDIPCYWKDGVRVDLPGGTSDGYANDIVVVEE